MVGSSWWHSWDCLRRKELSMVIGYQFKVSFLLACSLVDNIVRIKACIKMKFGFLIIINLFNFNFGTFLSHSNTSGASRPISLYPSIVFILKVIFYSIILNYFMFYSLRLVRVQLFKYITVFLILK